MAKGNHGQPGVTKNSWMSAFRGRYRITSRIGIAFVVVAVAMLGNVFVSTVDSPLRTHAPLFWLISIACCSFAGLSSMRTARTLRNIEDELLRYTAATNSNEVNVVAGTPRRLMAADPICDGWNRLLDLALANTSSDTLHRAVAPLDREAVTLARAMRGLPVAWVVTDTDARIRFISPVALGMLGMLDDASCNGRSLTEILGMNEGLVKRSAVVMSDSSADSQASESRPQLESQTYFSADDDCDQQQDSDLVQALGPVRMVTLRRDLVIAGATIKLRIVRSRLGGRSGDAAGLAWVLQDITQQQLATEARDQFLMTATHEFRTPLNNLQAYAEALNKQDGLNVEHQKEFCNIIYTEANRLGRLVDHLLTVSQMEAGSIVVHRHELELLPILEQVIDQNQSQALQKQITLTSSLSAKLPTVIGDRDKLQAAILNLVGNAIKYTTDGGEVLVSCEVDDSWIRIDVKDNGVGIPVEEQSSVFDKFFRGQQAIQSTEKGNGLGLAFSREIARMHDGDITLQSTPGEGSVFTMRLPIGGQSRSGV